MTDTRVQVVLDTETGGLDHATSPLIEVAWCRVGTYNVRTLTLPHDPRQVDPAAAAVNGYYERGLGDPRGWATPDAIRGFFASLSGVTIVGANPAFDASFLARTAAEYGVLPGWHYRLLDVESMAYALMPFENVPSLMEIVTALNGNDQHAIPLPTHDAHSDVVATAAVLCALEALRTVTA